MERVKTNSSFTRLNLLAMIGLAAAVLCLAGFAFLSRSTATAAALRRTPTLGMDSVTVGNYVGLVSNRLVMPVSARVKGPDGVVADATVVFAVDSGAAGFWVEGQSGLSSEVTVSSDADGFAQAWLFLPVDFNATNLLSITADDGDDTVQARLAVMLDDYSGTGTLQINTNGIPGPYAVATRVRLLNWAELGGSGGLTTMMMSEVAGFTGGDVFLSTELFLEPRGYSNDATYLTLHNTATNTSYQLLWKFDFNNESNWHPGQTITGNGSNVDFTPVPACGHQKMFFTVTTNSPSNTVSINFTNGVAVNAVEPDAGNTNAGSNVTLRVSRTGPTNAALPVFFNLSGSATYTNDYALQYTNGTAVTNGTVVIPAGTNQVDLIVKPVDDQTAEFDESVVVLVMSHGGYFVDTNHAVVQFLIEDNPQVNFYETVASLDGAAGIDYHPISNALVVSVGSAPPEPDGRFIMVTTNAQGELVTNDWSEAAGFIDEVKLTIVKNTANGFTRGEMFFGTGGNGVVGKLSPDGRSYENGWATLPPPPGGTNLFRGGFYVDQTGVFSNRLIVVSGGNDFQGGDVWTIGSTTNGASNSAVLLARLTNNLRPHLEGVITLPDDALKYGPWAGTIVTGAESALGPATNALPRIFTVAVDGTVATNFMEIAPEDFEIIPPNQSLYTACLDKFPSGLFTNCWGDVLITQSGDSVGLPSPSLFVVHWDSTNHLFYLSRGPYNKNFEHVSFAPIELPSQPPEP